MDISGITLQGSDIKDSILFDLTGTVKQALTVEYITIKETKLGVGAADASNNGNGNILISLSGSSQGSTKIQHWDVQST